MEMVSLALSTLRVLIPWGMGQILATEEMRLLGITSFRGKSKSEFLQAQCLINRASSSGRCNTVQCVDSTMLSRGEAIRLAILGQNLARVVFRLV